MKKILIIDNFDSFTFNLVEYFRLSDCEVEIHRNTIDPALVDQINPDLIVLSPGPSIPKKAGNLMKIIDVAHKKYPIFGVCLGHEALIEYFGGSLKYVTPVHGKSSPITHDKKEIFAKIPQDFQAGRYHSLAGAKIPNCFNITAKTEDVVMGLRHKTLPIYSVQFHPESILTMKNQNGLKLIKNLVSCI